MTEVIIFDFWGTVVDQGVYSPIKQVKRLLGLYEMPYHEFVVMFERAMMTTEFPTLRDAFEHVCKVFNIKLDDRRTEEFIGIWNKNWILAQPYRETIGVLQQLRETHKLVLIANTDHFSVGKVVDKFGLQDLFHHIFLSCDVGSLKTDPQFYKQILKTLGVQPGNCLAVGDSMQSDIDAAKNAGVPAVLIDRRDRRDFEHKIINLQELISWN